jgi:SAM-dependent methyltransferase
MKLSDLVNLKIALNSLSVVDSQTATNLELAKIMHLIDVNSEIMSDQLPNTTVEYQNLQEAFNKFDQQFSNVKTHVQDLIEQGEAHWFQESYAIYEKLFNEHHDYIMNSLRPTIHPETILRSRLNTFNDWRYPAMIIRPGIETFINEIVGCDPMYIVDVNRHFLGKVPFLFNSQYQNRLRPYVIEEDLEHEILKQIPDNQFGLCLVYNFFNHRTIEHIKKYLTEIYKKLRPGGVLIMTYNDCDRVPGVKLVEQQLACYTPGLLINQLAKNIGYDRFYSWNDGEPKTFLELRKPGELTSTRGGQTLAKVVAKSK